MRESAVEAYLARRVGQLGGEVRKVKWPGRRDAPDRLVMLPPLSPMSPRIFLMELKRPGEKPRASQRREHDRLRALGWWVSVADSPEAVDRVLRLWAAEDEERLP